MLIIIIIIIPIIIKIIIKIIIIKINYLPHVFLLEINVKLLNSTVIEAAVRPRIIKTSINRLMVWILF